MGYFFNKKKQDIKPSMAISEKAPQKEAPVKGKEKEEKVMTNEEKVQAIEDIVLEKPVKRIKKEKGLIERTESSKMVLTEDNKQLLMD